MSAKQPLKLARGVDFAATGYPAVREAFNEVLNLCVAKLTKSEFGLAHGILDTAALDLEGPGHFEMLADTALYSRKGAPGMRAGRKRAIDRIAPKLNLNRDPLKAAIAARLPQAYFSLFVIEGVHPEGGVMARDLLDEGPPIRIMDNALSVQAAEEEDMILAARLVDLGPWHIGFGIVLPLRQSEAVAIGLALSHGGSLNANRDNLHELLYPTRLHGQNLVMTALEPLIMALAFAIDASELDMDDIAAGLGFLDAGEGDEDCMAPSA